MQGRSSGEGAGLQSHVMREQCLITGQSSRQCSMHVDTVATSKSPSRALEKWLVQIRCLDVGLIGRKEMVIWGVPELGAVVRLMVLC